MTKKLSPEQLAQNKANGIKSGAVSKFTDDTINAINDYIDNYQNYDHAIPSVAGLAEVIDIRSSTIYRWAEADKPLIRETLEKLEDKQHRILLDSGLKSTFNSTITKLALHNHGYSEKTETNLNVGEIPSIDDYYND